MSALQGESYLRCNLPDVAPGVLVVELDRPPVNALSLAMFAELRDLFLGIGERAGVRCVVLAAVGRMFSAGADVKELSERTTQTALSRSVVSRACFDAIRRCPVPVIGAVHGAAIGAGAVIVSCCDIVLASEDASFSLPEILVGVMGGTRHLARMLPEKMVRYLALTGRRADVRVVERFGGVQAVLAMDRLRIGAIELAREIATRSPAAVRLMKEALNLTEDMPLNEGYRVEQLFTTLAASLPDAREASLAFVQKRPPVWTES